MALKISPATREKLTRKHQVNEDEILQCFANRTHDTLIDTRADHQTNPPTEWFISETDVGRKLKVVFVPVNQDIFLKTAYPANADEIYIYYKYAQKI